MCKDMKEQTLTRSKSRSQVSGPGSHCKQSLISIQYMMQSECKKRVGRSENELSLDVPISIRHVPAITIESAQK